MGSLYNPALDPVVAALASAQRRVAAQKGAVASAMGRAKSSGLKQGRRQGAAVGGAAGAAAGTAAGVAIDRKFRKSADGALDYAQGVSLVELSKAWKGEPGDKRNTKYYLAGAAGTAAGLGAVAAAPSTRRIQRVAIKRGNRATAPLDAESLGDIKQGMKSGFKAQYSTPGMKRLAVTRAGAGIGGAAAGIGAYAAYRGRKRD